MQILFIGNSFTYFNDMPYTFLNMIKTVDPNARVESLAYGGYTLSQYADENTEVGRLAIARSSPMSGTMSSCRNRASFPVGTLKPSWKR